MKNVLYENVRKSHNFQERRLHIFESQILISLFEKKKNSLSAALKDDIDGTTLFYESNNNDKAKLHSNDK